MRNIIFAAIALVSASTASAQAYYDTYNHHWVEPRVEQYYDRPTYGYGYRPYPPVYRHRDAGDVILPLIGGAVLGAIISGATRPQQPNYNPNQVYRQPAPRQYNYDPNCDCYR
jgi:hypothetical protein